jgi:hypothetical protein
MILPRQRGRWSGYHCDRGTGGVCIGITGVTYGYAKLCSSTGAAAPVDVHILVISTAHSAKIRGVQGPSVLRGSGNNRNGIRGVVLSGAHRSRPRYRIIDHRREGHRRAAYHLNFIVAYITRAAIEYEPIDVSDYIVTGLQQEGLGGAGALQVNRIAYALPVNAGLQAHVVTL